MAKVLAANNAQQPKRIVAAGGLFVEVVGIDGIASKDDLRTWVDNYMLTVTSVRDPDDKPYQSQTGLETRENSYIVDLRTMKIVYKVFGSYGGGSPSTDAINKAITEILRLLAL